MKKTVFIILVCVVAVVQGSYPNDFRPKKDAVGEPNKPSTDLRSIRSHSKTEMAMKRGIGRRNLDVLSTLWPGNTIPYEFDKSTYGSDFVAVKNKIDAAIQIIQENTCLRWIKRSSETNYVKFIGNRFHCKSTVGMSNPTRFWATKRCSMYGILHEMMHTFGFRHEQSRSDRYGNIKINWNKISGSLSQYEYENTRNQYPFDYHSIMLYTSEAITIPDKSLEYLQQHTKNEFPFYDRAEVNAAYKCAANCGTKCSNGGFPMKTGSTCSCSCPAGLTGRDCSQLSTSCGKVIRLVDGQSKSIQLSSGAKECTWLIKGETRVRTTINNLNLPATSDGCSKYLEIRDYLIGNPGKKVCSNKGVTVYTKMLTGDPSMMLIRFNGQAYNSQSQTETMLTVESFNSGCAKFRCTHGSTCVDGSRPGSYTCHCVSGFSGRHCDAISATSTTKCDFENDLAPCIFSQETDKSQFRWNIHSRNFGENRIGKFQYLSIRPFQNIMFGWKTQLVTTVKLEEADRCLTFSYAFRRFWYSGKLTKFDILYEGSDFQVRTMFSAVMEGRDTRWKTRKINLPALKQAKITIQGELRPQQVGIDNIILAPGLCGIPCVEANPCLNRARCVPQGSTYKCKCQTGFSGKYCQIREGFLCGFEENDNDCSLKSSSDDDFDWTRIMGQTPTGGTGPMRAKKGDYFMYIESNPDGEPRPKGEKAVLVSTNVFKETDYCLEFFYHMYDKYNYFMGSLRIKTQKGNKSPTTEWEKTGNQGNDWLRAKVNLKLDSKTKILIEGEVGSHVFSDIAIDDVKLSSTLC